MPVAGEAHLRKYHQLRTRGLEYYDKRTIDGIVIRLKGNNYRFNELVQGIVSSLPFDMKRGEESK